MTDPYQPPKAKSTYKNTPAPQILSQQLGFYAAMYAGFIFLLFYMHGRFIFSVENIFQATIGFLIMPMLALLILPFLKLLNSASHTYDRSLEYSSLILGGLLFVINISFIVSIALGARNLPETIEIIRVYFS